jgi:hypothetical protein
MRELRELPEAWFKQARELEKGDDYSRGAAAARETLALELQAWLRENAEACFAWGDFMVRGDKASVAEVRRCAQLAHVVRFAAIPAPLDTTAGVDRG